MMGLIGCFAYLCPEDSFFYCSFLLIYFTLSVVSFIVSIIENKYFTLICRDNYIQLQILSPKFHCCRLYCLPSLALRTWISCFVSMFSSDFFKTGSQIYLPPSTPNNIAIKICPLVIP